MEETQSFRLIGNIEIEEILCDHVDGQPIVYWEDIEQAFPGVQKVKNGKVIINMMRDSNRIRITPHCIKHYPGVVLDVILSSAADHVHVGSMMTTPSLLPADSQSHTLVKTLSTNPPTDAPTNAPVNIQSRPQAVLGKPDQFFRNPLPRLPIILPMAVRRVGAIAKPLPQHFKLFFLCECGAHTNEERLMGTDTVHLADHIGYDISRPKGLLEEFGTYILAVMRAVRAEVPSMVVAPLASSTVVQELRRIELHTQESISSLVDMAIEYLEDMNKNHEAPDLKGMPNPFVLENDDELFGRNAGPLCLYLDEDQTPDEDQTTDEDQTLGNLYRSITKDGDVHWVCQAHFQQNYNEDAMRRLHEVIKENEGSIEERRGKVDIKLVNETKAIAFFEVLGQVQGIQDLSISFRWNAHRRSFQSLTDAILKSNVVSLQFDDIYREPFVIDCDSQQRFDPLIQLLATGRIQSTRLLSSDSFFQQVSCLSAFNTFPTIRKMWTLKIDNKHQYGLFLEMVKKSIALQTISTSFPDSNTQTYAIQCIKACPSLQELDLLWSTFDFTAVFDLMDRVEPLLTEKRQNDRTGSHLSLRLLKVTLPNESITAVRSENGKMLVSTTSSRVELLHALFDRFGWAMGDVDFYRVLAKDHIDLRRWAQSIKNHGGVSNLQSLSLNESQLAPESRHSLLKIIEQSQGLKTLELILARLNDDQVANSVKWYLVYLGSRITTLALRLQEGRVHPIVAPLLSRKELSRLKEIRVFNEGQNNSDIRWLVNLVCADTGSCLRHVQASDLDATVLTHLSLNGIQAQDDSWKLLFETLDFKFLTHVSLSNSSIRPTQWTLLLDHLPKDGLLQDGSPVPLECLDISSTPLEEAYIAEKDSLKAELAERAPFAKLSFKDPPFSVPECGLQ